MLAEPEIATHVDTNRIGLLGHSSGGSTVVMLAGGKFSFADVAVYCRTEGAKGDKTCSYPVPATLDPKQAPEALSKAVRAVVALDPAVGPGFSRESLAAIAAPVLVIGSEQNDITSEGIT